MFYLRTHSTHFIYSYMVREREIFLFFFNDAFNAFYLRLYGVRYMVKYLIYIERGEREKCFI